MMNRWSIASAGAGGTAFAGQKLPDQVERAHGESDLAQEDSLDSNDGDDAEEDGD